MDLKSHVTSDGRIEILELSGRFDAYTAPRVAEWLQKAATAKPARVVADLGEVNFMDSTAMAALVRGMKQCREQEGDLRLCSLQQPVRLIFELTRLDKAFEIYPDPESARSSWGQ